MMDSPTSEVVPEDERPTARFEAIVPGNSVDATLGLPLVDRVLIRKRELEAALDALPDYEVRARDDLALALATIEQLLTGDLDHVPEVVAADMNRWLEGNKHLAQRPITPRA